MAKNPSEMRSNIGLLAVLIVTVGTATVVGQSSPNRRIVRDSRVAIASQLRPDDRHVILQWNGDRPSRFAGPPVGGSQLEWLAKESQIILVVRVERIDPVLIHRDWEWHEREVPAEEANWIVSRVGIRVDEIVKGAEALGSAVGDRLSLKEEGGSAMIRGRLVEAVYPWEMPMAPGKRYLLCGNMFNGRFVNADGYAESSTALLMALRQQGKGPFGTPVPDDMEQWTLDQAAFLMREALRQ